MDKLHFANLQAGRKAYQLQRTQNLRQLQTELLTKSATEIGLLPQRELFLVGIALYWAEGFKHKDESSLGFCTSDPNMAKIYLRWLNSCLQVGIENIALRVTINYSHLDRLPAISHFWSSELEIPQTQFTKPFFQKTTWAKSYPNRETYHGVIRIRVKKSLHLLRRMRGWLAGLASIG